VIVTSIPGPFADSIAGWNTHRLFVPVDRQREYGSLVISDHTIPWFNPMPTDFAHYRTPAILAAGARDCEPLAASDPNPPFPAWLTAGRPVFLDTKSFGPGNPIFDRLAKQFTLVPVPGTSLLRVLPRVSAQ
jgi:hypothetical protein